MADADVPITAGAGTKIDTRTVGAGTDEHRQVVVVGDPATAANVQAVSAAGAAKVDGSAVTQPVSGTFWQATQPVSMATQAPDVTDRATREVGRVRLWDGTDEATVIPRGSVPASTDKGLAVVPLNVSRPAYQVVSGQLTSPTAVAVTQVMALWHPSSLAKDVYVIEIGVNYQSAAWATGRFDWRLTFISADATTGGTTATPQPLDQSLPASGMLVSFQRTAGATAAGQVFQRAAQPAPAAATPYITSYDGVVIYRAKDLDDYSDAIRLRSGVAEGVLVQQDIAVTVATAPIFNIYARWIERA